MGVKTCLWISNHHVKFAAKQFKAKHIACELLVKRVVTFGVVLYSNQRPVKFILHFAELRNGSAIRYKILCLELFFQM